MVVLKLWKLCILKPEYQRGLTVKRVTTGTMKKGILFIYFHLKAKARINTAKIKQQTFAGAVGVFASIAVAIFFLDFFFFFFCKRSSALHSTGAKNGSFGHAFDFSMPT